MSNAPDRIWVENLNAQYRHNYNCSLMDPADDPEDHRVMDAYILKETAAKDKDLAMGEAYKEIIARSEKFNKILQPIKDYYNEVQTHGINTSLKEEFMQAIKETLNRANDDKGGN